MSEKTNQTERKEKIEALRKEQNITRAHAASIVSQEEAAKNKKQPTPEEISAAKLAMMTREARQDLERQEPKA